MGIKNLPKLIENIAGNTAIRTYKFSKFKGWTVSVDASLIIHQTVTAMRSSGKDLTNNKGELTSHLQGIFYKILIFLQNEMIPIFVFDGKAPDIKNKTISLRKKRQEQANKNLEKIEDTQDEEYIKLFKQTFKPTKQDIVEAQILLDLMGIPYIVAPGEADVVCSWLAARKDINGKRFVKGVCSDDSDMLPLGAPYLLKDMLKFMSKNKSVKIISLHKTLDNMDLTMQQFVDLCVLLGTDYCDNIKGIGPKNALILIKKYGTLEKVLDHINHINKNQDSVSDNEDMSVLNMQCMISAKEYFSNALVEIDNSDTFVITNEQLQLRQFQHEELIDFMCVKHGFDFERIQTGIARLKSYYQIMNVTTVNTKKVHQIIQPLAKSILTNTITDNIEFLSSEDDEPMPSKKITALDNVISKKIISNGKNNVVKRK